MDGFLIRFAFSLLFSCSIAARALKRKSVDFSAVFVGIPAMVMHMLAGYRFAALLLVFFSTSSKVTKLGQEKKRVIEADFKEGGQRNWEVTVLSETSRALGSFGSTDRPSTSQEVIFAATGRSFLNKLYNMIIIFQIPGIPETKVQAILDTGATNCCICANALPKDAFDEINYKILFSGINSQQETNQKVKDGYMIIGGHKFRIPFTFKINMNLRDGIQMLLGCNFIRSVAGGLRIEGTEVTFYKGITTINTSPEVNTIAKVIPEFEEYVNVYDDLYLSKQQQEQVLVGIDFKIRFAPIMQKLREAGFIREVPLQHWAKNKVLCKLDIINPDITIQDKPLKHITPAMEASFKVHIDALLQMKVIRPSESRHRTMAFIVQSGTSVDPITGKEKKGKERLVFNYKTLNDNTHKDQYSLPDINLILKKIGNSKIFFKFDLKSGFHQVMMSPDSISWTTFLVPQGLFE